MKSIFKKGIKYIQYYITESKIFNTFLDHNLYFGCLFSKSNKTQLFTPFEITDRPK